jgi:uncharacterized membrane protein
MKEMACYIHRYPISHHYKLYHKLKRSAEVMVRVYFGIIGVVLVLDNISPRDRILRNNIQVLERNENVIFFLHLHEKISFLRNRNRVHESFLSLKLLNSSTVTEVNIPRSNIV